VRQHRLPAAPSGRETHPARDVARAWAGALDRIAEPALRVRAALAAAHALGIVQRAIVFDEGGLVAGIPGTATSVAVRRLLERARRVLEDEHAAPGLYVARLVPGRSERLALRWRDDGGDTLASARALAATCAWALHRAPADGAPGGLPDASATLSRLEQLVHDARRMRRAFAVVYVDVEAADRPLPRGSRDAVARRLRRAVRANDHIGHLGGDAYVALVSLHANESEAYPAAQRLLDAARAAGAGAGCANAGVAVCPDDGVQPADLVEKAGAAAMAAASAGAAHPYWFREPAGHEFGERGAVRRRLREGDPGALFELRFDPIVDARSGAPWAFVAIATWRDATAHDVAPDAYLANDPDRAAREALERWTLTSAAEARRTWRAGGTEVDVAVRLSEPSDAAIAAIAKIFPGEAARALLVEIAAPAHVPPPAVEAFTRRLRALGVRTGVAASRATSAPFDGAGVLLDFITVDARRDVRAFAELALASVIAPHVVAEHVDDLERARRLARAGATGLRGRGLAAPLRLQELARWASDRRSTIGV
jgi:predicted signal transduction protein with EAL and GGDEF domain